MRIMIPLFDCVLKLLNVLQQNIEVSLGYTDAGQSVVVTRVYWTIVVVFSELIS